MYICTGSMYTNNQLPECRVQCSIGSGSLVTSYELYWIKVSRCTSYYLYWIDEYSYEVYLVAGYQQGVILGRGAVFRVILCLGVKETRCHVSRCTVLCCTRALSTSDELFRVEVYSFEFASNFQRAQKTGCTLWKYAARYMRRILLC